MKAPRRKTRPGSATALMREAVLQDPLEPLGVELVESRRRFGVHVEDGEQVALGVDDGHDDFADRAAVAGDVTREGGHVRHDLGLSAAPRRPANAPAEGDPQAAKCALVGPYDQLLALVGIDDVESGPEE